MKKTIGKKGIFVVAGIVLIFLIIFSLVCYNNYRLNKKYNEAIGLLDKKEYKQAVEIFDDINSYKESALYSDKCRIFIGDLYLEKQDFINAENEYKKIKETSKQKELLNKCSYQKAKKLYSEKNYEEARKLFENLTEYEDSSDYLRKCKQEIKYKNFDYTGKVDTYKNFYTCYGEMSPIANCDEAESYFGFVYGTWYDEEDIKIEISDSHFNGKEYGVCAVSNNAAVIYFNDNEDILYELYCYDDYIAGKRLNYSKMNDYDNSVIYNSITTVEYEKAYKEWEEEQAKIPRYSDGEIINRASSRAKERLSSGYSATEQLYHSFSVDSSSVSYDWVSRTYTCYLTVTYSSNIFDMWGVYTNTYDVTATFRDTGTDLISTGFSVY